MGARRSIHPTKGRFPRAEARLFSKCEKRRGKGGGGLGLFFRQVLQARTIEKRVDSTASDPHRPPPSLWTDTVHQIKEAS